MLDPIDPAENIANNGFSPISDESDNSDGFVGEILDIAEDAASWVAQITMIHRVDALFCRYLWFCFGTHDHSTGVDVRTNSYTNRLQSSRDALDAVIESEREQKRRRNRWLRLRDGLRDTLNVILRRKESESPGALGEAEHDRPVDTPKREVELFVLPKRMLRDANVDSDDVESSQIAAEDGSAAQKNPEPLPAFTASVQEHLSHEDVRVAMSFVRREPMLRRLRPPRRAAPPREPEKSKHDPVLGIAWHRWRVHWVHIDRSEPDIDSGVVRTA